MPAAVASAAIITPFRMRLDFEDGWLVDMGCDYSIEPAAIHYPRVDTLITLMNIPLNTPRALIQWGADQFEKAGLVFSHGTDNALDEAASLVMHTLRIGYDQPDSVLDEELAGADRLRAVQLLDINAPTRLQRGMQQHAQLHWTDRVLQAIGRLRSLHVGISMEPQIRNRMVSQECGGACKGKKRNQVPRVCRTRSATGGCWNLARFFPPTRRLRRDEALDRLQ